MSACCAAPLAACMLRHPSLMALQSQSADAYAFLCAHVRREMTVRSDHGKWTFLEEDGAAKGRRRRRLYKGG